jgi:acyl-CoA reductase-like NAD-dependent aldehyde dehydrogenase
MVTTPLWINGRPTTGGGGTLDIHSPWNGDIVNRVSLGTAQDVEAALASAHAAFEATRRASSADRSAWLTGIAEALVRRRAEIGAMISREAGKPITLALLEVDRATTTFRLGAEEARRIGGEVVPLDAAPAGLGRFGLTRRFPRGVVSGIVPYNFPLNLAAHKVAPALAAGCPIVLKPPPQAPGATMILAELATEAGAPPGAVNTVFAPVGAAQALVTDPRVAVLSFTGSAAVGWELKSKATRIPVILELGGNNAVIVDETADLDRAAERCAQGSFLFAGQVCTKAQRIIVIESMAKPFREKFLAAVERLAVGDPSDPAVICGPVIDDGAATRIQSWVEAAIAAGAKPLKPLRRDGRLLSPCILENVPAAAQVRCDEIFGPVVLLDTAPDFETALSMASDSAYGLQAGVFTARLDRARRAFDTLNVGAVILDDAPVFRVDSMPYGGIRNSGFGREGLRYAIEEMTEMKLLVMPPAPAEGSV